MYAYTRCSVASSISFFYIHDSRKRLDIPFAHLPVVGLSVLSDLLPSFPPSSQSSSPSTLPMPATSARSHTARLQLRAPDVSGHFRTSAASDTCQIECDRCQNSRHIKC